MHLVNVGNIDQGKGSIQVNFCASFLACLTGGSLTGAFAIFHEATGQGPVAAARLDGALAHEDIAFPFGYAADDESWILVMDMAAG